VSLLVDVRRELVAAPATASAIAARLGADPALVSLAIGHWRATGVVTMPGCSAPCVGPAPAGCGGCPLARGVAPKESPSA